MTISSEIKNRDGSDSNPHASNNISISKPSKPDDFCRAVGGLGLGTRTVAGDAVVGVVGGAVALPFAVLYGTGWLFYQAGKAAQSGVTAARKPSVKPTKPAKPAKEAKSTHAAAEATPLPEVFVELRSTRVAKKGWLDAMDDRGRWTKRYASYHREGVTPILELRAAEDDASEAGVLYPLQQVHSIDFDAAGKQEAAGFTGINIALYDGQLLTLRCNTAAECGEWVLRLREGASLLAFSDVKEVINPIDYPDGRFSDVFRARARLPYETAPRLVAIKTLSDDEIDHDPEQGMLLREIQALRRMPQHVNVIQFFGSGSRPDHRRFYIMVSNPSSHRSSSG